MGTWVWRSTSKDSLSRRSLLSADPLGYVSSQAGQAPEFLLVPPTPGQSFVLAGGHSQEALPGLWEDEASLLEGSARLGSRSSVGPALGKAPGSWLLPASPKPLPR